MILKKIEKLSEQKNGLLAVLCVSTLIKISLALSGMVINKDGILYIATAQQFAMGNFMEGLGLYYMPFYPLLITLSHWLIPNWIMAARLISITASILYIIPLYFLTQGLFNRRAAFWGCLALSIVPVPNGWALDIIRGPCFIFLFAWAVYFAVSALEKDKPLFFFAAAVFTWLSILIRVEGLIIIPVYLVFLSLSLLRKPESRPYFFRGVFIWISFPIAIGIFIAAMGHETLLINNTTMFWQLEDIVNMRYLDNYHRIYEYLKESGKLPPFSGGSHSFAKTARYYIHTIYLLGLLQGLIKNIFPFLVIPLFIALKNSDMRNRGFVFTLIVFHLFVMYLTLLNRDFLSKRFLLMPAFLLYPWIGAGLDRMFSSVLKSSSNKISSVLFALFFVIFPIAKCAELPFKQNKVIPITGRWLKSRPELEQASIITTDARFPFYAHREFSRKDYWRMNRNTISLKKHVKDQEYDLMEDLAVANKSDLIVIKIPSDSADHLPDLRQYKLLKKFDDGRSTSMV